MAAMPIADLKSQCREQNETGAISYPGCPPLNCWQRSAMKALNTFKTLSCFSGLSRLRLAKLVLPLLGRGLTRILSTAALSLSSSVGAMIYQ
jgi:hypothetical protein